MIIDIGAIGGSPDAEDLGSQFFQGQGGNLIGCAIGAVNHNAQTLQCHVWRKAAFGVDNIAATGIFDLGGTAYARRFRIGPDHIFIEDHVSDFVFCFVQEFIALGVEEFDAIVVKRIVRG